MSRAVDGWRSERQLHCRRRAHRGSPDAPPMRYCGTSFFRRRAAQLTTTPFGKRSMSPSCVTMTVRTCVRGRTFSSTCAKLASTTMRGGAGILQLMLELARCVERIRVDDGQTDPQSAEHRDRILQDVRHHQGDAVALGEAVRQQPRTEVPRSTVDLGVGKRRAPVVKCGSRAEALARALEFTPRVWRIHRA